MRLNNIFLVSVSGAALIGLSLPVNAAGVARTKLELLPYSGSVLVARAIRAGTIHITRAEKHQQRASKTPNKVFDDVNATAGTSSAIDETPIAANPVNAKQLITGGNDYGCTSLRSFWTSNDGGTTWAGGCAADLPTGAGDGDPVLGYDLNGTVYQGGIEELSDGTSAIEIASSTNNGKTWNAPVAAATNSSGEADKPWLAIDNNPDSPNKNNLYISNSMFNDDTGSTTIFVTTSKDGGKTWKSVAASPTAKNGSVNQFSVLTTGADGTVYLAYMTCTNGSSGSCAGTTSTMFLQKSTNAGKTWSKQTPIGQFTLAPDGGCGNYYGSVPNTCVRLSDTTSLAIDTSGGAHDGQLYFSAFSWNGTNTVVQVTSSADGGATWTAPVPVGDKRAKNDQFYGWMSVSPSGDVGVSWMDRRNDPSNISYEEYGAISKDGGVTFGKNRQLASQPSDPANDGVCGCFIGDYSGSTFAREKFHSSWTDTRNSSFSQDYVGGIK